MDPVQHGRSRHQLWYYEALVRAFSAHLPGLLTDELTRTVSELRRLVADAVLTTDLEVAELRAQLEPRRP